MTILTGDIIFSAIGQSDTNPVALPNYLTGFGSDTRFFNEKLRVWSNGGFYTAALPTSSSISSRIEMGSDSGDQFGPALLDTSANGYVARCRYDVISLRLVNAGTIAGSSIQSHSGAVSASDVIEINIDETNGNIVVSLNGTAVISLNDSTYSGLRAGYYYYATDFADTGARAWAASGYGPSAPTLRKGSQFTAETTLSGTVTAATLNGQAITVDSQVGTTVTLTDSDGSITTSGEYPLVLTDDSADPDETITVQVNVYGVAPANNPVQKDGAALASLTNVELRVSSGATLAGSQLYYSGTGTTDASGNLGNIDLSSTAAADTDPVLLSIRTAAGDSIITAETVGLI